jgi:aconitase A
VELLARIDTQIEAEYFRQGGVLPYVLTSQLAGAKAAAAA